MKLVIQRVKSANVIIDGRTHNKINMGYLIYFGLKVSDNANNLDKLVNKVINLRIFSDINDKMNLSILDVKGEILLISQFTLYGDITKGHRPSFTNTLEPNQALKIYDEFITRLSGHVTVKAGVFGANMEVCSINDGPVTIIYEI